MIEIKTKQEIEHMIEGGKIAALAMNTALKAVRVGVKLSELNAMAEKVIKDHGGESSFKMVEDYQYTTCININAGIVHGIPNGYRLKRGDLVSIDLGVFLHGLHTDLSHTVEVDSNNEEHFLQTGQQALAEAISNCKAGNRLGSVSNAIQSIVEGAGYTVSRDLVGHGVGKSLHEDPHVPGYGRKEEGPVIKEGMVFAIEVIYQKGKPRLSLDNDGWTLKTADNSLSGLFESTVAVTGSGPLVLTLL